MCVELIMIMIDVIFHTTVHFRAPKICRSRHHCQVPPHRRANFCRGGCSGNRRTRFWSCCRWWPTRRTRSCAKEQLGTTEGPLSGKQGRATPQRRLINVEIKWNGLDHFLRLEIETGYPPASDMLLHRMWLDIATITYPGGCNITYCNLGWWFERWLFFRPGMMIIVDFHMFGMGWNHQQSSTQNGLGWVITGKKERVALQKPSLTRLSWPTCCGPLFWY